MSEYEHVRRAVYDAGEDGLAVFVPVCEQCGRFVRADQKLRVRLDAIAREPNATCRRCGRTTMLFEGWFDRAACEEARP